MKSISETVDSFLAEVEFNEPGDRGSFHVEHSILSFWLPREYKDKYSEIQRRSNRKFGKALAEIIKSSIDRIEIEGE